MIRQRHKLSKKQRLELIGIFSAITVSTFIISTIIVSVAAYFIVRTGTFHIVDKDIPGVGRLILLIAFLSVILNLIFVAVSGKVWLKPVNRLIDRMNSLASGDYSARMDIGKPFGDSSVLRNVSDSFNTMAEELQNTEVLRSDFINNFSHEFKTPIVSIAGFAKLLKRGNLTEEQKNEYIDIIEEESLRLSYMANNVLNLTNVENQTILTDVSEFNLSEQIRSAVLLLEDKWTKKNLEMYIDFDEYIISANAELLKHVWINLIDNAIKFSPEYGVLEIKIEEDEEFLSVLISNSGEPIPDNARDRIFNKFYQADESHSSEGNGIGLAIVKRVTELHGGSVAVRSKDNLTTFTVKLPKAQ
jgi:signal transduction histidine kinase